MAPKSLTIYIFSIGAAVFLAGLLLIPLTSEQANPSDSPPNQQEALQPTQPDNTPSQKEAERPKSSASTPDQKEAFTLYEIGLKFYYERNFDEALKYFNEALALNPESYQALNAKGATYAFLGQYDEGLALIKEAQRIKPDFVYAHFNEGLANELAGRWDESIAAYNRALSLDSNDTWSYYGIASIYGRQGKVEKVIEYLKLAIALEPEVKAVARDEHDFAPVRNDQRFQALVKP